MILSSDIYKCRLCGFKEYLLLLRDCESSYGEVYSLRQCSACSFVTLHPLPKEESLKLYYDKRYWQQPQETPFNFLNFLFYLRMKGVLLELKRLVAKDGRILDWGAGDGSWLRLLRKAGFEGWGLDRYTATSGNKFFKKGTIETAGFPEGFFDAITCFHVLEHLEDPVRSIKKSLQILKPGGLIIVEVPNIASWGFKVFKKRWQPLETPTHLNHFSPKTLTKIFKDNAEVEIIKISYFSQRASPAAFVLSLFPNMNPKIVRQKAKGKYYFPLKILYLVLQIIVYPITLLSAFVKRGSIIRIYIRKK